MPQCLEYAMHVGLQIKVAWKFNQVQEISGRTWAGGYGRETSNAA
jgi:hypothetical protein